MNLLRPRSLRWRLISHITLAQMMVELAATHVVHDSLKALGDHV